MIPKVENFIKCKHVNIEAKDSTDPCDLASTSYELSNNVYTVRYNTTMLKNKFYDSWLSTSINYDEFETGVLLHEYAHIMYSDFCMFNSMKVDGVLRYIWNILEDARVEYRISKEYPTISLYFYIVLGVIRDQITSDALSNGSMSNQEVDAVKDDLTNVYNIVRFNRSYKQIGEFESIVFCLAKNIKNGEPGDVLNAAKLIQKLLCSKNNINKDRMPENDISKKMSNSDEYMQIIDRQQMVCGDKSNSFSSEGLKQAIQKNKTNNIESNNNTSNKIYNYVIANYSGVINNIRQLFKHILSKKLLVDSYDGEIDLKKQQELYLSEKIGEEGMYYKVNKVAKEGADVVICRDISGSTHNMKEQYAQIVCIILAALEKINGMNTCLIDFETTCSIVKSFNQKMSECMIDSLSMGGTNAALALRKVKSDVKFKNTKRLCIVVSDGSYDSRTDFDIVKKELEIIYGVSFLEILINNKNGIKLEDLPKTIYKFILEELKK